MKTKPWMKPFRTKVKIRQARCKHVMVILDNRPEIIELVREEIHPPVGDFVDGPMEFAIVRWHGLEVFVSLDCVVFLAKLPAEPPWIREARAKFEQELVSKFNQELRGHGSAGSGPRGKAQRSSAGKRLAKFTNSRVKTKKVN